MAKQRRSLPVLAEERIAALERASRTRADYDMRCEQCKAPHWMDTSLPSEIWNQIARPEEMLCLLCIDARLAAKGLTCNQAEFYFVGKALTSKLYAESHGTVAERDRRIAALKAALLACGHRPYRKNTTHWHESNDSVYCPGCAALKELR